MSRIDELIARLCPDGVSHHPLGAVASYSDARVDAADLDETSFVGVDNLVANKGGKVLASYLPNTDRLTGYRAGDVLLGNIRPYLKKVWLASSSGGCSGDVLAVRIAPEHAAALVPKFLYYLLSSDRFFAYNMQHAKGAKMPRGNKSAILNFSIPVPPSAIQHEIVGVLDTFTQLEAELEAELEARRRQYEHYRDAILSFPKSGEVRWLPMGELGTIFGGLTGKSKADFTGGNARFVSYVNVFRNISTNTNADDYVRVLPTERQRGLRRGDLLFTGSSENAAEVGMSSVIASEVNGPLFLNSFCIGVRPHDPELLTPGFAKHLLRGRQMRDQIVRTASGVTRFNVSKARLAGVLVPIPSPTEQARIADQLDRFDALVNDHSVGLPAELAARRKQYEHYRDRLLTFTELAA